MSELIASNWRLCAGAILPIVAFFLRRSRLVVKTLGVSGEKRLKKQVDERNARKEGKHERGA